MIADSAVAAVSDRRRRSEIDATIYVAMPKRVVAAPDSAAFTARVPWAGPAPTQATAIDESGAKLHQVPIRREGATLIVAFDRNTFVYELR